MVDIDLIHHFLEKADREAGNTDEPSFSLTLRLAQGRDCFPDNLVDVAELHVMDLNKVEVVDAEPLQTFFDAARDACGGKIEITDLGTEPGNLRRQQVTVAGHPLEGLTKNSLSLGGAVVGCRVDEVDSVIEGGVNGTDAILLGDRPEDGAKGGSSEGEFRDLDPCFAKRAIFHGIRGGFG